MGCDQRMAGFAIVARKFGTGETCDANDRFHVWPAVADLRERGNSAHFHQASRICLASMTWRPLRPWSGPKNWERKCRSLRKRPATRNRHVRSRRVAAAQASDPDREAPPEGGSVGGYNAFWLDGGENRFMIDGELPHLDHHDAGQTGAGRN